MAEVEFVWYKHPVLCWSLGRVVKSHGVQITVADVKLHGEHTVNRAEVHPHDTSHDKNLNDIAFMNNMHEGPLLDLLRRRYMLDSIYTFTGDILISINPYKLIPGLYTIPALPDIAARSSSRPDSPSVRSPGASPHGDSGSESGTLQEYSESHVPHVYAVAERSYKDMLGDGITDMGASPKNQSLIVSGESGAGKTEACKYIMKYLACLSQAYCVRNKDVLGAQVERLKIEKKVLDCNPFLEAFGNAKTVRNDNSSRFGKFLKIEYDGGRIIGARMRHYLLEKARVIGPHKDERNYHIFYQFLCGASPEEKAMYKLASATSYAYLISGGVTSVEGVDDRGDFATVREALLSVGVSEQLQQDMWRILAAILHLGNIRFADGPGGECSVILNHDVTEIAAEYLGTPTLAAKLVKRLVAVGGRSSAYEKDLNAKQASGSRDALAKAIYEKLFSWIVSMVNDSLASHKPSSAFIGILDIFGFEIFTVNSFEQLCINYANEKLQSLFNMHIFVMEQELYRAEGVDVASIEFINNQPCVDLIEKAILPKLDDMNVSTWEKTDEQFLDQLSRTQKDSKYFGRPRLTNDRFSVFHFAGEVQYYVEGFLEKNNDTLYTDLEMLMHSSTFAFLPQLFSQSAVSELPADVSTPGARLQAAANKGPAGRGKVEKTRSINTIASTFKRQLAALESTLLSTRPHYVRCIKPNKLKAPNVFESHMILDQLLYSGVLETVRIRRQGFPFRQPYAEFWPAVMKSKLYRLVPEIAGVVAESTRRFPTAVSPVSTKGFRPISPAKAKRGPRVITEIALKDSSESSDSEFMTPAPSPIPEEPTSPEDVQFCKDATVAFLTPLLERAGWTTGLTKVFLKDGCMEKIHHKYRSFHSLRIQAWFRCRRAHRAFLKFRKAVRSLQRMFKRMRMRKLFAKFAKQLARLQAHVRRRRAVRRYKGLKTKRNRFATRIQSCFRQFKCRKVFLAYRRRVVKLQRNWRLVLSNRRLAILRSSVWKVVDVIRIQAARMREERLRRAAIMGATKIQSFFRMVAFRKHFRSYRKRVCVIQSLWRRRCALLLAVMHKAAIVKIQATWRMKSQMKRYKKRCNVVVRLQAWWRGSREFQVFRHIRLAAARIKTAMLAYIRNRALMTWVQELHAACTWGDVAEIKRVLNCDSPAHHRVRDVPVLQRVQIRHRHDALKSPLHAAAASGSVDAVNLLLNMGVDGACSDALGCTPLHKAVAIGDANIDTVRLLLNATKDKRKTVNAVNVHTNETPLDVAVAKYQLQASSGSDAVHFNKVVSALMECGGKRQTAVGGKAVIDAIVAGATSAASITDTALEVEQAAMRRRQEARKHDPHYQFLFVSEAVRQAQTAAASSQSTEEKLDSAASLEAKRLEEEAMQAKLRAQQAAEEARLAEQARLREEKRAHDRKLAEDAIKRAEEKAAARQAAFRNKRSSSRRLTTSAPKVIVPTVVVESVSSDPTTFPSLSTTVVADTAGVSDPAFGELTFVDMAWEKREAGGSSYFFNPVTFVTQTAMPDVFPRVVEVRASQLARELPQASSLSSHAPDSSGIAISKRASDRIDDASLKKAVVGALLSPPPVSVVDTLETKTVADPARQSSIASTQSQPKAEPVWTVHLSRSKGALYFFNRVTGSTQWTEPHDFDGEYEDWMPRHNSHGQSKTTAASISGKQSSEGQPEVAVKSYAAGRNGWAKVIDEEGYTFFYNEATGETQWDAPPDF